MAETEGTEEYEEKEGKWVKVEPSAKRSWKLIVTTREATKEIEPLSLVQATRLSKCLLQIGEPIAMTKLVKLAEVV